MNPLGMVEAILGAMQHSADISGDPKVLADVTQYVHSLRSAMHNTFRYGQGT